MTTLGMTRLRPTARAARSAARRWTTALTVAVCLAPGSVLAQPSGPLSVPPPGKAATEAIPMLKNVGVDQRLNQRIPGDVPFVDETGKDVRIGDYFGAKPVILVFAYYECPMLCTQVINAVVGSLQALPFNAGREFNLVVVSIDPGETPTLAAKKREAYLDRYRRPGAEQGIHFLTGRESSIQTLTSAAGFKYAYDPAIDQYAHPAVITILTSDARVSRYLFGIEFAPRDVRLALVEAGENKVGSVLDQALLFCYHYDPETGQYGFAIMNMVRLAGLLTVGGLGTFIVMTLRRERRQGRAVAPTATGTR